MTLVLTTPEMQSLGQALRVLASPLESASAHEWRSSVLTALQPLFDADAGALVLPVEDEMPVTLLSRPARYLDDYTRYQHLDLSMDYVIERDAPVTCTEEVCQGDRRTFTASTLYDLVYHEYRIEDAIWTVLDLADEPPLIAPGRVFAPRGVPLTGLLVLYSERPGKARFGREGLALMTALRPLLQAAEQTWKELGARRTTMRIILDELEDSLAVYDSSGALLHRNPALARLLASEPRREVLEAAARAMAIAVSDMLHVGGGNVHQCRSALQRDVTTGAACYRMHATRADAALGLRGALLLRIQRVTPRTPSGDRLRHHFGLTEREAQVALLLAAGASNRTIGHELGISEHTARRHTEKVLLKMRLEARGKVASVIIQLEESRTPG